MTREREPPRAATASNIPRNRLIHQVARTPQPRARSVGDWVWNTSGWKTVKYSRQTRAVT